MWGKDGVGRGTGGKKGLKKGGQECKVRKAVGLDSLILASFIPISLPQSSLFYFPVKIYFPFYQTIKGKIVPAFN